MQQILNSTPFDVEEYNQRGVWPRTLDSVSRLGSPLM